MNLLTISIWHKVLYSVVLLFLVPGSSAFGQSVSRSIDTFSKEQDVRQWEPVDSIISDLESYIPEFLEKKSIPGVAIALIRGGKVIWTEGYGLRNSFTTKPVSGETPFELASNSKIVTAYIALRLVDQNILSLDKPLNTYLSEPWLPLTEYRDVITLRQVLSHSSGLRHNSRHQDHLFPPGSAYYYSNIGFSYLQEVIEHITRQSLEEVAQEMAFKPLRMSSSSYINQGTIRARLANGHVGGSFLIKFSGITFVITLLCVMLPGLLIHKIRTGRWLPANRVWIGALILSFVLWVFVIFILFGIVGFLKYAWLIAIFGLMVVTAYTVLYLAGRAIIDSYSLVQRGKLKIMKIVWGVLLAMGLILIVGKIENIPVPKWPSVRAMAHASFRSTAEDLAAILLELSNPQYLSDELSSELKKPQINLSEDLSWGLGLGIQHSQQGDALWQWGQNVDFQSVMIIYPEIGFGVVVMSNSESNKPDVAIEIAHRALGGKIDPILSGSHLEFNYRAED